MFAHWKCIRSVRRGKEENYFLKLGNLVVLILLGPSKCEFLSISLIAHLRYPNHEKFFTSFGKEVDCLLIRL